MIAVDTNILVYAHREDSQFFRIADARLTQLAESGARFAIPWPCLHEFLAIVTHPRIYNPPTPLPHALDQVASWLEIPGLVLLGEKAGYWPELHDLLIAARIVGPRVHDARIAALCRLHRVDIVWSADRDLTRFAGLEVENPLQGDHTLRLK
ncbi:MAG: PIN domain-containing protein [Magnetococcales bacterium]|nr:PIN domain-containing protein [Magnetococcales bacterium]